MSEDIATFKPFADPNATIRTVTHQGHEPCPHECSTIDDDTWWAVWGDGGICCCRGQSFLQGCDALQPRSEDASATPRYETE